MEPQKPNNFEEEWQRAFNDASVSPPSDMWDRIERELKEKKRRPFLFFIRPSAMIAGVAAALLVVLSGLFFFNKTFTNTTDVTAYNSSKITAPTNQKKQNIVSTAKESNEALANDAPSNDAPSNDAPLGAAPSVAFTYNKNSQVYSEKKSGISKEAIDTQQDLPNLSSFGMASMPRYLSEESVISTEISAIETEGKFSENADNQLIMVSSDSFQEVQSTKNLVVDLSQLQYKNYQYLGSRYTLYRNKLAFDVEVEDAPVIVSNESKFWLGVQSGVSPFDPNMKLGELNAVASVQAEAFAQSSNIDPNTSSTGAFPTAGEKPANITVSQPQNAIKSGIGTNTGFAMGCKISKKWYLESGIRYLRGNSTLQSNTYAFQQNGYVNTFLGDYLLQNSANNDQRIAANPINTVIADASQFGNRYEYLMIPMQLGYEISLTKKLGLNLLAGVSTDIFLQNTITNDNSILKEKSVINGSNNVYKQFTVSGLGGVRASYLLSKHWQATLGSTYQQSLFSGINTTTALQMRLRMLGLNYGINYRF